MNADRMGWYSPGEGSMTQQLLSVQKHLSLMLIVNVWLLVFFTGIWCYKTGTGFTPCFSLFLHFFPHSHPQILRYGNCTVFPSVRHFRPSLCCSLDFRSSEILISNFPSYNYIFMFALPKFFTHILFPLIQPVPPLVDHRILHISASNFDAREFHNVFVNFECPSI